MMNQISSHKGGIFYDLAGHVIDQIVYLKGEPKKITSFIRKDFTDAYNFFDNAMSIFEYDDCITSIDISASTSECKEIFTLNFPRDLISCTGCINDGLISSLSTSNINFEISVVFTNPKMSLKNN